MMIYQKKCEHEDCGKQFVTTFANQKYCSKKCRMEARTNKELGQICWYCKRAGGGCAWSQHFKPVNGWTAKPTIIKNKIKKKNGNTYISLCPSYRITECPEFIHK